MQYIIDGKEYTFCKNYRDNEKLRSSMDLLAGKTFGGLSFEEWYRQGFWTDKFIPYTLFYGDKAAANISVNLFHMDIQNKQKRYIQLGTVMTDYEHRHHGLSRFLMEKVLDEWQNQCDAVYLYANDSVLDFYPRFGFIKEQEYQYQMPVTSKDGTIRKLDLSNNDDKKILIEKCCRPNPFASIRMTDSFEIIMFYCISAMRDNIYYLEDYDAVVIAKQKNETFYCYDVFCNENKPLNEILSVAAGPDSTHILFGFTPKDIRNCNTILFNEDDLTLFVLKNKEDIFKTSKLMLPVLSHT